MYVDVSIVIVSYNARAYLEKCLKSVYDTCDGLKHEVFVVDNDSHDGSADLVETGFPDVRLIRNPCNAGFAAANNLAIPHCKGEFVFLLNNDTELQPGCLQQMLSFARAQPDSGAVGCRLVGADGRTQQSAKRFKTVLNEIWPQIPLLYRIRTAWGSQDYDMSRLGSADAAEVDYVCGAATLLRKKALNEVGLLDDQFFMYSEEEDLCWRLKARGWKTYYLPGPAAVHHGGASARTCPGRMHREFHKSRILFLRKHRGRLAELAFRALCPATVIAGMTSQAVRHLMSPTQRGLAVSDIQIMRDVLAVCLTKQMGTKSGKR